MVVTIKGELEERAKLAASHHGLKPDVLIRDILSNSLKFMVPPSESSRDKVINIVCGYYDTDPRSVMSKSQKIQLVEVRQVIAYFLRTYKYSLERIGLVINRDHSSVHRYIRNVESAVEDPRNIPYLLKLKKDVETISNMLNA